MKKNMGMSDRVVRIVIAIIFIALYATGTVTGIMSTVLLILGGVFILTSLVSFCPLYTIFGFSTCAKKK